MGSSPAGVVAWTRLSPAGQVPSLTRAVATATVAWPQALISCRGVKNRMLTDRPGPACVKPVVGAPSSEAMSCIKVEGMAVSETTTPATLPPKRRVAKTSYSSNGMPCRCRSGSGSRFTDASSTFAGRVPPVRSWMSGQCYPRRLVAAHTGKQSQAVPRCFGAVRNCRLRAVA